MSERPHSAPPVHDGEMSSIPCCDAILAASDSSLISNTEFRVLVNIVRGRQSRADIAKAAQVSVPTVARAIAKLVSLKWVDRIERKGKASILEANLTRIIADTHITHDTTEVPETRITERTRITHDTGSRITSETAHAKPGQTHITHDTGPVDNRAQSVSQYAPARAQHKTLNTSTLELYPETSEDDFNNRAREKPIKVLNGTAATLPAHVLAGVLVEQVSSPWLDPNRSQRLITTQGMIAKWIEAGADFDADILPTVRVVMRGKSDHVRTWGYFDAAVRQATADRLQAEQPMETITAAEAKRVQSPQSSDQPTIRREPVSAATAARMQRKARRDAERQPIDLGRVASVRID